ncbi:hypothetical protein VTP01DRAFT_4393 [Rhizomucor pusillus]|uniref:uncharacterized protein n=1 Tax=Rhizomucor pusillus TaxID=4840 RepID=UPI00374288C5
MVDFCRIQSEAIGHKRSLDHTGDVQKLKGQHQDRMVSIPQPEPADHKVPSITYASPDYRPPMQSYFCWIPQPDALMDEVLFDNANLRGSLESGWSTGSLGQWHQC